jgi:hypothetical protein
LSGFRHNSSQKTSKRCVSHVFEHILIIHLLSSSKNKSENCFLCLLKSCFRWGWPHITLKKRFVDKSSHRKELVVIPVTRFLANIAVRELKFWTNVRDYVIFNSTIRNLGSMAQKAINQAITKTHTTEKLSFFKHNLSVGRVSARGWF